MKNKINLRTVSFSAVVAAAYAALTFINPLSFGVVQFRVSELLTVLAAVTPAAIPGLTVGCFLSNLTSFMPLDAVFGTTATLLAAAFAYLCRSVQFKGLPVLSALMPVVFNGVFVGAELCIYMGPITLRLFFLYALSVAAGEAVVCAASLLLFPAFCRLQARLRF